MPVVCRECTKYASFGRPGTAAQFCGKHKQDGMILVYARRCACGNIARFGIATRPTHCQKCKTDDMRNYWADRYAATRKRNRASDMFLDTKLKDILTLSKSRDAHLVRRNPSCTPTDLSFDFLMELWERQGGKCAISGLQMTHTCRPEDPHAHNVSLDRIDSNINYRTSNVHFVCVIINTMKWNLPMSDFVSLCRSVVEHNM